MIWLLTDVLKGTLNCYFFKEDDLSPEHHRAILTALLAQGQFALALKYSRSKFIRKRTITKRVR